MEENEIMAIQAIKNYLNKDFTDDEIREKYGYVIKMVIKNLEESTEIPLGVTEVKDGESTIVYKTSNNLITEDIKMLLPRPYIKVF